MKICKNILLVIFTLFFTSCGGHEIFVHDLTNGSSLKEELIPTLDFEILGAKIDEIDGTPVKISGESMTVMNFLGGGDINRFLLRPGHHKIHLSYDESPQDNVEFDAKEGKQYILCYQPRCFTSVKGKKIQYYFTKYPIIIDRSSSDKDLRRLPDGTWLGGNIIAGVQSPFKEIVGNQNRLYDPWQLGSIRAKLDSENEIWINSIQGECSDSLTVLCNRRMFGVSYEILPGKYRIEVSNDKWSSKKLYFTIDAKSNHVYLVKRNITEENSMYQEWIPIIKDSLITN